MMRHAAHVLLVAALACSDPADHHLARLGQGGKAAAAAKRALVAAARPPVASMIAAFRDYSYPVRARVDLAEILYRVYLRDEDERVPPALSGGLDDPGPEVRTAAARWIGRLRRPGAAGPLVDRLAREEQDAVRSGILDALAIVGMTQTGVTTAAMTAAEQERLLGTLVCLQPQDLSRDLRAQRREWLEVLAEERSRAAREHVRRGELQQAEALLLAARELVPGSKNMNRKLGRFYYDNGRPEKGVEILTGAGLVARAHRMPQHPQVDGVLEEPAWEAMASVAEFSQCVWKMGAYPAQGRTEAYLGYLDNRLYVAVKAYEASTLDLTALVTQRDGQVWLDDCVEVFLDTNLDSRTFYQIMVNSLGIVADRYHDGTGPAAESWNGEFAVAAAIAESCWVTEIGIPAPVLHDGVIRAGSAWGLNVARNRMARGPEYGQWAPTHGFALRPDRFGLLVFE